MSQLQNSAKNGFGIKAFDLACVLVVVLVLACYVWMSCEDMIRPGDQSRMLSKLMAATEDGTANLWDGFWAESAGHRGCLYFAIIAINYWIFGYSTFAESVGSVVIVGLSFCLFLAILRLLMPRDAKKNTISYFISSMCLALICVSWSASNMFTWSIGIWIFLKSLAIVIALLVYNTALIRDNFPIWKAFLLALVCPLLLVFVLGGYYFPFLAALSGCLLLFYVLRRDGKHLTLFLITVASSVAGVIIYGGDGATQTAKAPIPNPVDLVLFVLRLFGNALLFNSNLSTSLLGPTLGGLLVLVLLLSFVISVRRKPPNFFSAGLIAYSLLFAAAVAFSRLPTHGMNTSLSPRYIPEIHLGLIGVILQLASGQRRIDTRFGAVLQFAAAVCIIVLLFGGIKKAFDGAPYAKSGTQRSVDLSQKLLFSHEVLTPEETEECEQLGRSLENYQAAAELCILYGLSAFRESNGYGDKIYLSGDWEMIGNGLLRLKGDGSLAFANSALPTLILSPLPGESSGTVVLSAAGGEEIVRLTVDKPTLIPEEAFDLVSREGNKARRGHARRWHKILFKILPSEKQSAINVTVVDPRSLEVLF